MAYPTALHGCLHFLWAGLARLGQTGALVPSQRFLIDRMIEPVPPDYRGQIVELGAGIGALTVRLAARCPGAKILACEINPTLAHAGQQNLARAGLHEQTTFITDPAQRLLPSLGRNGLPRPDFVISGIPLGNLRRPQVLELLALVRDALPKGGLYIQYQHSLLDRRNIRGCFPSLRTVPVWLNLPPAVVYYARR